MSLHLAGISLSIALLVAPSAAHAVVKFVALPDTQIYSENRFPGSSGGPPVTDPLGTYRYFTDQTQWVADNAAVLDIDYVVHLGDIVDNGDVPVEWVRGKAALDILDDAGIPYGTAMGNHDRNADTPGGPHYETYVTNFGPQHFAGQPWYGGASPTGSSSYQIISDGENAVLFMNLALSAPAAELAWADEVLRLHRDKVVVVTTHAWMYDLFAAYARFGEPEPLLGGAAAGDGVWNGGKSAQEIYLEFIKSHPNVVMAQGGHFDADLYRLDGRNGANLPVLEIVSDYQSLRNGGDGYLRIYEFDFDANEIRVDTYSPTLDRARTTFEHFVNAVWLIYEFRSAVADALGINEDQAFAIIAALFQGDAVPGVDVIGQHPDYLSDQAYYDQLFLDQFRGTIPPEIGTLNDWELLWMNQFAADPDDPTNYGPGIRSPAYSVDLDFAQYTRNTLASATQQACITAIGGQIGAKGALLSKRNSKNEKCIRDEGKQKLSGTVDACLAGSSNPVRRAEAKTKRIETKRCIPASPEFGVSNATTVNEVVEAQSLGMTTDLFGPAPRDVAPSGTAAYRCQTAVSTRTNALLETMLLAAVKEAKRGLTDEMRNGADLAMGMLSGIDDDPDGIVARFRSILSSRIARHCHDAGVDVADSLPGPCASSAGDPTALTDCLETRARCRACRAVNGTHGSAVSCDYFDDGESVNLSCP